MGLGHTWSILCLINWAAAFYASGDPNSFRICGDDLIGLWTPAEARRYESFLTDLGLVMNKSKTFYAPQGVFCELLVVQDMPGQDAKCIDLGHIAQYGASRYRGQFSSARLAIADMLSTERPTIRRLNQLRLDSLRDLRPNTRAGPIRAGGCGQGIVEPRMLPRLVRKGCLHLTSSEADPVNSKLFRELKERVVPQHYRAPDKEQHFLQVSDVNVWLKANMRQRILRSGRSENPDKPTKLRHVRHLARSDPKVLNREDLKEAAVLSKSLSSRAIRSILWAARRLPAVVDQRDLSQTSERVKRSLRLIRNVSMRKRDLGKVHVSDVLDVAKQNPSALLLLGFQETIHRRIASLHRSWETGSASYE